MVRRSHRPPMVPALLSRGALSIGTPSWVCRLRRSSGLCFFAGPCLRAVRKVHNAISSHAHRFCARPRGDVGLPSLRPSASRRRRYRWTVWKVVAVIGIGLGLFFGGYTLLVYGWSQIHSSNASIVQLVWPGSFQGANPDPPNNNTGADGGQGPPTAPTQQNPNPKNPLTGGLPGVLGGVKDTPYGAGRKVGTA